MGNEIKMLAEQLRNFYDGENWPGESFIPVVKDISYEVAFTSPVGDVNSIAAIVHHLMTWREFFIKKYDGDTGYDVNQKASFDVMAYSADKPSGWNISHRQA